MKIDIYRHAYDENSTLGVLFVDGQEECFTLEPSKDHPAIEGHPCIPAGEYDVILTMSPHLKYVTPEILNVPGRSAIRIHIANFPRELLGCTAVGDRQGTDLVELSKVAFDRLMVLLKTAHDAGEKITAEWHEPKG